MWTKLQFEKAAEKIGEQFVVSSGAESIDDMAAKVAATEGLNPDGIRTMVRLANVNAFEKLFAKRAKDGAEDRMIEFDLGDPEKVINRLYKDAQEKEEKQQQEKTASYNHQLDFFGDIPKETIPLEKIASAVPGVEIQPKKERTLQPHEVKYAFLRAEDRIREQSQQATFRWVDQLEKAARCIVAKDSNPAYRTHFEKTAVALLGEKIIPELMAIQFLTNPTGMQPNVFNGEKVASVLEHHVANPSHDEKPIIDMMKKAQEARVEVERCDAGIKWIADNMPGGH